MRPNTSKLYAVPRPIPCQDRPPANNSLDELEPPLTILKHPALYPHTQRS